VLHDQDDSEYPTLGDDTPLLGATFIDAEEDLKIIALMLVQNLSLLPDKPLLWPQSYRDAHRRVPSVSTLPDISSTEWLVRSQEFMDRLAKVGKINS
jgi:hypothetical protein